MRGGGERGRTVERHVRFDHHHVALFDKAFHAAERSHGGADGLFMIHPVGNGEGRQHLADFRCVVAELETFDLLETGYVMIRLPKLPGGEAGTGDERPGNAQAHEKLPAADGIFRQRRGRVWFRGTHTYG